MLGRLDCGGRILVSELSRTLLRMTDGFVSQWSHVERCRECFLGIPAAGDTKLNLRHSIPWIRPSPTVVTYFKVLYICGRETTQNVPR